MIHYRFIAAVMFSVFGTIGAFASREAIRRQPRVLRYQYPATNWEKQALPIGNGRLGGMVFGGVERERIQFNEDSLWIGDEEDTGAYQAFGDLYVEFDGQAATPEAYERMLDIDSAIHTVCYSIGGTNYRRTYFSSYPAQVMVLRFTADKPGAHTGKITLTDAHEGKIVADGNRITSSGSLAGYTYRGGSNRGRKEFPYGIALQYEAQVLVLNEGGQLEASGGEIAFKNCDSLTILLAAGTDYLNQREKGWKGEHPHRRITAQLAAAQEKSFDELRAEQVRDYQNLFRRCAIDVGETPRAGSQPAHRRAAGGLPARRQRPGPGRTGVPARPVHDDQLLAPRHLAGEPAGHVEPEQPAAVAKRLPHGRQRGDEAVAMKGGQTVCLGPRLTNQTP